MKLKAILFDMDSTLNVIDELDFSRTYFQMLHCKHFSDLDEQYFYDTLTDITKTVMLSNLPQEFTIKTFMTEMSKIYKRKPDELLNSFKDFYSNDYNELEMYVKPAEDAVKAVQLCFDKGYDVVIATTPIFTETAIMTRLKWSGMSEFDFKLITHAENMHFSKPRNEYYTEILKKIKRKASECIMVGNEFMGDIVGPTRLGMPTFYCPQKTINDELFVSPELKRFSKIKPTYQGTLSDFVKLLETDFE